METLVRTERKLLRIAEMDFHLAPIEVIEKELGVTRKQVYLARQKELYKQTLEELKEAYREKILKTPGTIEIQRTNKWALAIGIRRVGSILSNPKTANRDVIAGTRLAAQISGFISAEKEKGENPLGEVTDEIAAELKTAMSRSKVPIQ